MNTNEYKLTPQSLRIGNKVRFNNCEMEVISVDLEFVLLTTNSGGAIECFISELSPIPLTEEWLLKFGFRKVMCKDNYVTYSNGSKKIGVYEKYLTARGHGVTFHYVHQLQNIYFALTNEELTIK